VGEMSDVVVVGGGSAGLTAARTAVGLGARVALVDKERLGGECLWSGCVPSKSLIAAARVAHQTRRLEEFGLRGDLQPGDLGAVMDSVHGVIAAIDRGEDADAMRRLGIDVALGPTRFRSPRELEVDGRALRGRAFIICTGSRAAVPSISGLDTVDYLTNETLYALRVLPERLLVVGGGPVGVESAQAFRRLGAEVTVIAKEGLLPREDGDVRAALHDVFVHEGITVERGTARRVARDGAEIRVYFDDANGAGEARGEARGDRMLIALGRRPNVEGLELEAASVAYDPHKGVTIDPYLRTTAPHIFACGDVTGPYRFTHAAGFQAAAAVRKALFPRLKSKVNLTPMPWTAFTDPEVARAGQTEEEARRAHGDVVALRAPFTQVDRAYAERDTEGFVKLVVTPRGKILGGHIVGAHAGEYIQEVTLAMRNGLGALDLARTIHVYPTLSMAVQQAALGYYGRTPFYRLMRGHFGPLVRRVLAK